MRAVAEKTVPGHARDQVTAISSDVASPKLFAEMQLIFPNMRWFSLDAMHLCFAVDSHTKKQRVRPTVVGLVMRTIMGKFHIPDPENPNPVPFSGGRLAKWDTDESAMVQLIKDGAMPLEEAEQTLKDMDPNSAMKTLAEFARLIAAVVATYSQRLDIRNDKTTLRKVLLNACSPDRFQWYLNNVRYRTTLPPAQESYLAAGTTRNEQLHARLNAHYHTTCRISKRALDAELDTWLSAEMSVWTRAYGGRLTKRVTRVDMLPFITSTTTIFTQQRWKDFLAATPRMWVSERKEDAVRKSAKRKGPTDLQEAIYRSIVDKTVKRPRSSVYLASGRK
jgi:hypothetical protein